MRYYTYMSSQKLEFSEILSYIPVILIYFQGFYDYKSILKLGIQMELLKRTFNLLKMQKKINCLLKMESTPMQSAVQFTHSVLVPFD